MSMPTLYILAENQAKTAKVATSRTTDSTISQTGTPNGRRASMTMGEVKGMMEPQNTIPLSGALKA